MRLTILLLSFFIFSIRGQASTVEVVGPCSETPKFISENTSHDSKTTLGDLTVQIFEQAKIPFRGSREGIASIFDSPTGDDAIEILSNEEARFYGWCVKVDDVEVALMPDEVILTNPNSKIRWFYAYATSLKNKWTEVCVPSYKKKTLKVCH